MSNIVFFDLEIGKICGHNIIAHDIMSNNDQYL